MVKGKKNRIKKIKKELQKDKLMCLEFIVSIVVLVLVLFLVVLSFINDKHTVTFNSNGGTIITSKRVLHNETVAQPSNPIRDGYEFVGWYYNDEIYSFDKKVTGDIELIAKWEKIVYSDIKTIELNFNDIVMPPNSSIKLKATINPNIDEKIYWESSDSSIAEVNGQGVLTSKEEGTVTIKVSTIKGLSDEIKVTVKKEAIPLKSIAFKENELSLSKGSVKKIEISFEPYNASNQNVIWTSDNTNIVSVDETGVITAKEEGTASVIATTLDGDKIQKCKVTVISD